MIFIVACLAVMIPVLLGGFIAWVTAGMDTRVNDTKTELEERDRGYNPALTLGHQLKTAAPAKEQLKEAQVMAAKKAAALPRGANMRIGRLGQENLHTAGEVQSLENDPITAVRIAEFHGWDGAKTGAVTAAPAAAPSAAGTAAPTGKITLVPGKDYPVIEITEGMTPDEKRKARIANSKAKSAAMKAAKAAGVPAAAPAAVPVAAGEAAPASAPVATAVAIEPPQLVELTDELSPDDKRKARIANSKAKSAFNKALKAAGIDPKSVEIKDGQVVMPGGAAPAATPVAEVPAAAPVAAAEPAPGADPAAAASAIPKPDLIELTDDMSPDDKRKARIANSKAKSAYNKALKAAGIDPKSVK